MKHPLTSKERRGLVAVAAAALLCVSSGFILRNCSCSGKGHDTAKIYIQETIDSGSHPKRAIRTKGSLDKDSVNKKKRRKIKGTKKRAAKDYPVRDPLSQPCD